MFQAALVGANAVRVCNVKVLRTLHQSSSYQMSQKRSQALMIWVPHLRLTIQPRPLPPKHSRLASDASGRWNLGACLNWNLGVEFLAEGDSYYGNGATGAFVLTTGVFQVQVLPHTQTPFLFVRTWDVGGGGWGA